MLKSHITRLSILIFTFIISCKESIESDPEFIETFEEISIGESEQLKSILESNPHHPGGRITTEGERLETSYGTLMLDRIIERVSSADQIEPNYSIKLIPPADVNGTIEYLIVEYRGGEYYTYILQYEPTGDTFETANSLDLYSGAIRTLYLNREIRSENYYENGKVADPENGRTTTFTDCDCSYDYQPVYGPVTGEIIGYDTWIVCTCSDGSGGGGTGIDDGGSTGGGTPGNGGGDTGPNTGTGGGGGSNNPGGSTDDAPFPVGLSPFMTAEEEALYELLVDDPFALIDIDCDQIQEWQNLAQNEAPLEIKNKINQLQNEYSEFEDFAIQTLNDAGGTIVNLDYFAVNISTMPIDPSNGLRFSPQSFLDYFRRNINDFVKRNIF